MNGLLGICKCMCGRTLGKTSLFASALKDRIARTPWVQARLHDFVHFFQNVAKWQKRKSEHIINGSAESTKGNRIVVNFSHMHPARDLWLLKF